MNEREEGKGTYRDITAGVLRVMVGNFIKGKLEGPGLLQIYNGLDLALIQLCRCRRILRRRVLHGHYVCTFSDKILACCYDVVWPDGQGDCKVA